jgi:hypothetical protein
MTLNAPLHTSAPLKTSEREVPINKIITEFDNYNIVHIVNTATLLQQHLSTSNVLAPATS